ncbi:MAG: hypothetical protein LBK02_08115 [Treponema sp.]|jgi:hypothetical protein|nr:hypothetical protein [Treponema sp.]
MVQFYFLSILLNGLTGYILSFGGDEPEAAIETSIRFSLNNNTFRLVLGILITITGLLKILAPIDIPVLGDLLPALLGLAAGFVLFFEYYRGQSTVDSEKMIRLEETIRRYKKWLGFALLVSSALHFLFPRALFL